MKTALTVLSLWVVSSLGAQGQDSLKKAPIFGPPAPVLPVGPTVQVRLSKPLYHIRIDPKTGAPMMPTEVTATAQAIQWPTDTPRPSVFTWRVTLEWNHRTYPTAHSLGDRTLVQGSPLHVNFGQEIRGGKLTVFARTELNGQPVFGAADALVVGDNPPRSAVLHAFPHSRFGLIASKIGMAESGLCQFTRPYGADPGGMPEVSRTDDIGLMQLNVTSGGIESPDQIWDWRANLRQGLAILEGKRRTTLLASRSAVSSNRTPLSGLQQLACLNLFRAVIGQEALPPPGIPPLSEQPGSGVDPADPDVDHVNLSQFERDAIRRYNGGSEYAFTLTLDPIYPQIALAGWTIDPQRGGIDPRRGDPDYVRHVLAARSGFSLAEPPKPTSTPRSRRNRKHHHTA